MKGGNEATNGSGITQFAVRRTETFVLRTHMDELTLGSPLPHCLYKKNPLRRRTAPTRWIAAVSAAPKTSREVRKVRKVLKIT